MPSIQFYADKQDFEAIFQKLSGDPDIAVILPAGKKLWVMKRWIARPLAPGEDLADGRYCLWHVPGGALPRIEDPFAGWTETRGGSDPRVPFFGSVPAIVELFVNRRSTEAPGGIGQSAFGWIGNRYRAIGHPASPATEKWWRQLRTWVGDTAAGKVTRWGNITGPDADIWAFPSAHEKILAGAHRDANPSG